MSDTANNNVISLDKYDSARRKSGYGSTIKALEEMRELCRQRLTGNVRYMMTKCDDTLYGYAQMAESSTVEELYLGAMHDLKAISGDLEKCFIDHFVEQFNLGIPRHIQQERSSEPGTEQDYSDSTYLTKELASENLAVCRMIEKTRSKCAETLQSLDRRIGFLIRDPDLELWKNPLSPEPVCEAFRKAVTETVSQFEHGIELRPVLFNLFDEYVLGDMDAVYRDLNLHLVKIGVQPQPLTNTQIPGGNAGMTEHEDPQFPNSSMPHTEPAGYFVPEQDTNQTDSVFVEEKAETGGLQASNSLSLQQQCAGESQLNQNADKPGDITIDVVAMMFERILEDKNIAGSMRALLGRLQIPLIKVAIREHRFFSDKNHPARLLLNRLTDSAIGWEEELGHEDPMYRKIDSIVQTILNGFEQDTSLFSALLEDLEGFLGNTEVQKRINAQRSIKVLEGEKRLEDARSKAMEQVEEHTRSGLHLDFINHFVTTHWKDLLFLICARQGKESDEWKQALVTMDDLVWSVKPKNSEDEHRRLMSMQPALLNSLREGMRRLSVPVTEQDEFLAKLACAHAGSLPGNVAAKQRTEPEHEDRKVGTASTVVIEDESGSAQPGNFNTLNHSAMNYEPGVDDIFITQARQLQPGTWIEIAGSNGKTKRVKLSWKSPITNTYLCTDQMGLNAGNYSIEELAQLLRSARARS
jgi:hypothetical protein